VIFGCGFLGEAIARSLAGRGCSVWGVSRNREDLGSLQDVPGFYPVCADLPGGEWERELPQTVDAAVYCAGAERASDAAYRSVYISAQRRVLAWCERTRVRRFVFTGSAAVYPHSDGRWVEEPDADRAGASPAGRILLEAEALAAPLLHSGALASAFVLRLAGLYGPGRHLYLDRLRSGDCRFAGSPESWLNLIHRDDAAAALLRCLDASGISGHFVYNVSDGNPATRGEIIHWLAERVAAPAPVFERGGEGARSALRRGALASAPPNRRIAIGRIRQELDWRPRYPGYRHGYAAILAGMGVGSEHAPEQEDD